MTKDKGDEPADISAIGQDDQALTDAAYKKKSGDPAVDALIDATMDIDSEPFDPGEDTPPDNVTPIGRKKGRNKK